MLKTKLVNFKLSLRLIATILIITFLTSCAINLQSLVKREAELRFRDDFNSYLSREYLHFSRDLANRYNWRDSDYFATKGLRAANNREIFPEIAEVWGINSDKIEEISVSRKRLQLLSNPEVKYHLPIQLAHLFLLYDCWISYEGKDWNISGMSRCKTRFHKLVKEIEEYIKNLKEVKEVKVIEVKEPEFKKFDIYFDFNSSKFNSNANNEFLQLLNHLEKLNGDFRILLSGNADRKGKKIYNAVLARKRVLVVRDLLLKNGVPRSVIETLSGGEVSPKIITKNNKRNKYNRQVGIYVLKGSDLLTQIPLPLIDNYIYKKEIKNLKKNRAFKEEY